MSVHLEGGAGAGGVRGGNKGAGMSTDTGRDGDSGMDMDTGTGATIFGLAGTTLAPDERRFFRDADPFGFILFSRNVEGPGQLRRLTAALREAVGREAPVFIDQEGGRVQRLGPPHWRQWSPPLDAMRAAPGPAQAARLLWLRMALIAAELRALGIDANCAPVADIAFEVTHPFLANRCYGTDAATVSALALAAAEGLLAGGVLPVVKHIPGHGRAQADSHHELPRVEAGREELEATDFAPFRALRHLPMAMTAHVVYPALDAAPATLSAPVIGLIRERIGFDGLLMTDDLTMAALSGGLAGLTRASLAAGCDLALHCTGDMAGMQEVAAAAGAMNDAARSRARRVLALRPAGPRIDTGIDTEALAAELALLEAAGAA